MTLAEKLAQTFVKAAEAEVSPRAFGVEDVIGTIGGDKAGLRDEFEESMRQEEVLRAKAKDYARLARQRALSQDPAGTDFLKRLLPLPYSAGEAAWRVPTIAAGGVGGLQLGKLLARRAGAGKANPEEVARVMRLTEAKKPSPLEVQLEGRLGSDKAEALRKLLRNESVENISRVVGKGQLGSAEALAKNLAGVGASREALQEAYLKAVPQSVGKEKIDLFTRPGRGARWGSALGGAGLAGILTGLPMAIRGAALRRTGGELAHKARKRVSKAVTKAEREQFRRENIVRSIEGKTPLPLSEWKAQKKQMGSDWNEAIGDYRALAKARRKGEKRHGAPIPAEGEEG
jgi:hypothetical protein